MYYVPEVLVTFKDETIRIGLYGGYLNTIVVEDAEIKHFKTEEEASEACKTIESDFLTSGISVSFHVREVYENKEEQEKELKESRGY